MHCSYLLTPEAFDGLKSYVGYTVDAPRRLRQHNGELTQGAKRTASLRPWRFVCVVMGFPSRFSGLSFEFAWQHPHRARLCSVKMQPFKKTKGLGAANSVKRKLLQLKILLSVCKPFYTSLPEHISCTLGPVDDAYQIAREVYDSVNTMDELDNACIVCDRVFCTGRSVLVCKNYSDRCSLLVHPTCLAQIFLSYVSGPSLIPDTGNCPICSETLRWADLVKTAKQM